MKRTLVAVAVALTLIFALAAPAGADYGDPNYDPWQYGTKVEMAEAWFDCCYHPPVTTDLHPNVPPIPVTAPPFVPQPGWVPLYMYDDQPVRRSCDTPLQVWVAAEDATDRRVHVIQEAIDQLHAASGLPIVWGGLGPGPAEGDTRLEAGQLWVVWRDQPGVRGYTLLPTAGPMFQNTGFMVLDEGTFPRDDSQLGIYYDYVTGALAVALHEFGHVAGLGHPTDSQETLMQAPTNELRYWPNDLAGLSALGCH